MGEVHDRVEDPDVRPFRTDVDKYYTIVADGRRGPSQRLRLSVARNTCFPRVTDQPVEVSRTNGVAGSHAAVEFFEYAARQVTCSLGAAERDHVAVRMRLYAETVLDQGEMAVVFSEEPCDMTVILERDHQALVRDLGFGRSSRSSDRIPTKCCQSALQTSFAANRHFEMVNVAR